MPRSRRAALAGSLSVLALAATGSGSFVDWRPATWGNDAVSAPRPGPSGIPLAAPAGHELVATFLVGDGVQIYECIGDDGDATRGTWRGRPVATLVGEVDHGAWPWKARGRQRVQGTHDSLSAQGTSPVPQWSLIDDGSRVVGRLAAGGSFPAPDPSAAIAALRLDVVQNSGVGRLADVDLIQRDLVSGGVGPTGACDPRTATATVSHYAARYTFWTR